MTHTEQQAFDSMREALEANHKHHQDHDDYSGYPGSELCAQNASALAAAKAVEPQETDAEFYGLPFKTAKQNILALNEVDAKGMAISLMIQNRLLKKQATEPQPERQPLAWQPIETAPKDGTEVLLYSIGDIGVCYWRHDDVLTGWTWGIGKAFGLPTRWMPLPEAPASGITSGNDCTPNHLCQGRMIHLPTGEACDRCGFDGSQQ